MQTRILPTFFQVNPNTPVHTHHHHQHQQQLQQLQQQQVSSQLTVSFFSCSLSIRSSWWSNGQLDQSLPPPQPVHSSRFQWHWTTRQVCTRRSNLTQILFIFHSSPLFNVSVIPSPFPSVFTSAGGTVGSGLDSGEGKRKFVSYDTALGSTPGMTTCASCQQQVMTNVTYKAGTYAWLMCLLFICCGWEGSSGCGL